MLGKLVKAFDFLKADVKGLKESVAKLEKVHPIVKEGKPGRDGKDAIAPSVEDIVAAVLEQIPTPKDGVSPDAKAIVDDVLAAMPKPRDGRDAPVVSVSDVAAIVLSKNCELKNGKDGKPGRDGKDGPSLEAVVSRVKSQIKDGKPGAPGEPGKPGRDGKDGASITDVQLNNNELFVFVDGRKNSAGKIKIPAASAPFNPGNAGGGGGARQPFNDTGFCVYNGNDYTEGSPLVVPNGVTLPLANNGEASQILSQCPKGGPLYDPATNRITPNASGDALTMRVSFKAFTTSNNGGFSVAWDISAAGDGSILIASKPVRMLRGTGAGNTAIYTVDINLFALDTFLQNGGTVLIIGEDGTTSIYEVSYLLTKTHSAV